MTIPLLALTCKELTEHLTRRCGKGGFIAMTLYREFFKKGNATFLQSTEIDKDLLRDIRVPAFAIANAQEDGVCKFTTTFDETTRIESVIIPALGRTTLCVSSQAGCKMGCTFCATGTGGFVRNLSVEEIVYQVYSALFTLKRPIDNIVFMGMGEPFDNFNNVMQSINVIGDQRGFDIPQSRITISTAGHCDGIAALAHIQHSKVRIAVSINAPNDGLRNAIMPINKKYPLSRLKEQLLAFPLGKRGVIFIEYVLFNGINDSREMAHQLADFVSGLPVRINLIAYNQNATNTLQPPSQERIQQFASWLVEKKLFVRIRKPFGKGINAACGQLTMNLK
jgi:23S rRNA (adenine2503-C2)-methyltransferase